MANLSEKIARLLNTAPVSYDPEDDIHEETVARVVSSAVQEDSDEEIIGKLRKQNVELLEHIDKRYKGKRASRKSLGEGEWSGDDESVELSPDSESEEDPVHREGKISNDSSDDAEDNFDSSKSDSVDSLNSDEDVQESFTHIEEPDVSEQMKKGQCVRQQLNIWENLLEMRIQLQKCLIASNKLPIPSVLDEIKRNHSAKFSETKKEFTTLLDKLLYLQLLLTRKYPETKSLLSDNTQTHDNKTSDDDEEIPSDTEDEQESDLDAEVPKKKQKLNYASEMGKRYELYKKYRDTVIQKWNDKTRIASNKSGNNSHSVVKQIDHILNDKDKLIKRTQLSRIDYGIKESKLDDNNANEIYSSEIFDDTDFYHQLLRELIEYKSADLTDPVQLGRQWIQLQSLRSKMKRKIDTRATKGRKIRYAVHSKLVNFMAPIEDITWQNDAKTELYNSLFGKGQPVNKV